MVRVNKTQFPKDLRDKSWKVLHRMVRQSNSREDLKRTFGIFLTPDEMVLIEKRIAILLLLARGTSYREIGRTIDVSPTTVNFVKHRLTRKPRVPKRYDPLPPLKMSDQHWMKRAERGKKRYYMGARIFI